MKLAIILPVLVAASSALASPNHDKHDIKGVFYSPRCANETHSSLVGSGTSVSSPATHSTLGTVTTKSIVTAGTVVSTDFSLSHASSAAPFANATESGGARGQSSLPGTGTAPIATGLSPTPPTYGSSSEVFLSTGGTGTGFPTSFPVSSAPFLNATTGGAAQSVPTPSSGFGTGAGGGAGTSTGLSSSQAASVPVENFTTVFTTTTVKISLTTVGTGIGTGVPQSSTVESSAPFTNATTADQVSTSLPLTTGGTGTGAGSSVVPTDSAGPASHSTAPFVNTSPVSSFPVPNYEPPTTSSDVTTTVHLTQAVSSTLLVTRTSIPLSTSKSETDTLSNGAHSESSVLFSSTSSSAAPTSAQLPSSVSTAESTLETTTVDFGAPPTYGFTPTISTESMVTTQSNGALSQSSVQTTSKATKSANSPTSAHVPSMTASDTIETILPVSPTASSTTSSKTTVSSSSTFHSSTSTDASTFTTSMVPASTIAAPVTTVNLPVPSYLPPQPAPTYLERRDTNAEPMALPYRNPAPGFPKSSQSTSESGVLGSTNWLSARSWKSSWLPSVRGLQGLL